MNFEGTRVHVPMTEHGKLATRELAEYLVKLGTARKVTRGQILTDVTSKMMGSDYGRKKRAGIRIARDVSQMVSRMEHAGVVYSQFDDVRSSDGTSTRELFFSVTAVGNRILPEIVKVAHNGLGISQGPI